jgi:hypothetical protein
MFVGNIAASKGSQKELVELKLRIELRIFAYRTIVQATSATPYHLAI